MKNLLSMTLALLLFLSPATFAYCSYDCDPDTEVCDPPQYKYYAYSCTGDDGTADWDSSKYFYDCDWDGQPDTSNYDDGTSYVFKDDDGDLVMDVIAYDASTRFVIQDNCPGNTQMAEYPDAYYSTYNKRMVVTCDCICPEDAESNCDEGQVLDKESCECVCSEGANSACLDEGKEMDEVTCECVCSEDSINRCDGENQELDEDCNCICANLEDKEACESWNENNCECMDSTSGTTQTTTTGQCINVFDLTSLEPTCIIPSPSQSGCVDTQKMWMTDPNGEISYMDCGSAGCSIDFMGCAPQYGSGMMPPPSTSTTTTTTQQEPLNAPKEQIFCSEEPSAYGEFSCVNDCPKGLQKIDSDGYYSYADYSGECNTYTSGGKTSCYCEKKYLGSCDKNTKNYNEELERGEDPWRGFDGACIDDCPEGQYCDSDCICMEDEKNDTCTMVEGACSGECPDGTECVFTVGSFSSPAKCSCEVVNTTPSGCGYKNESNMCSGECPSGEVCAMVGNRDCDCVLLDTNESDLEPCGWRSDGVSEGIGVSLRPYCSGDCPDGKICKWFAELESSRSGDHGYCACDEPGPLEKCERNGSICVGDCPDPDDKCQVILEVNNGGKDREDHEQFNGDCYCSPEKDSDDIKCSKGPYPALVGVDDPSTPFIDESYVDLSKVCIDECKEAKGEDWVCDSTSCECICDESLKQDCLEKGGSWNVDTCECNTECRKNESSNEVLSCIGECPDPKDVCQIKRVIEFDDGSFSVAAAEQPTTDADVGNPGDPIELPGTKKCVCACDPNIECEGKKVVDRETCECVCPEFYRSMCERKGGDFDEETCECDTGCRFASDEYACIGECEDKEKICILKESLQVDGIAPRYSCGCVCDPQKRDECIESGGMWDSEECTCTPINQTGCRPVLIPPDDPYLYESKFACYGECENPNEACIIVAESLEFPGIVCDCDCLPMECMPPFEFDDQECECVCPEDAQGDCPDEYWDAKACKCDSRRCSEDIRDSPSSITSTMTMTLSAIPVVGGFLSGIVSSIGHALNPQAESITTSGELCTPDCPDGYICVAEDCYCEPETKRSYFTCNGVESENETDQCKDDCPENHECEFNGDDCKCVEEKPEETNVSCGYPDYDSEKHICLPTGCPKCYDCISSDCSCQEPDTNCSEGYTWNWDICDCEKDEVEKEKVLCGYGYDPDTQYCTGDGCPTCSECTANCYCTDVDTTCEEGYTWDWDLCDCIEDPELLYYSCSGQQSSTDESMSCMDDCQDYVGQGSECIDDSLGCHCSEVIEPTCVIGSNDPVMCAGLCTNTQGDMKNCIMDNGICTCPETQYNVCSWDYNLGRCTGSCPSSGGGTGGGDGFIYNCIELEYGNCDCIPEPVPQIQNDLVLSVSAPSSAKIGQSVPVSASTNAATGTKATLSIGGKSLTKEISGGSVSFDVTCKEALDLRGSITVGAKTESFTLYCSR